MSTELVVRSTVRELVKSWEAAVATIRLAFGMLVIAEADLNKVFALGASRSEIRIDAGRGHYRDNFEDVDDCLARMRKQAWATIIERLELQRMMSKGRWAEMQRMLDKGELPEITEDNVLAFAQGHAENLGTMLQEAIVECFNYLRPRLCHGRGTGWSYKTNERVQVGRKVILPYAVESYSGGQYHLSYGHTQDFVALENVFTALDGKGQISKSYGGELGDAVKASGAAGVGETTYFRFKCFRNRNLHLEFKRLDLLAKFNQIAGGANLKPAAGAERVA